MGKGKGERVGRDGKLTRSLLLGALEAANKEGDRHRRTRGRMRRRRGNGEMGREEGREGRSRVIGDRLAGAMEALCAPLPAIEAIFICPEMTNLSRPIARIVSLD